MIVKLISSVKSSIWGGRKLKEEWNKQGGDVLSESWELSFHPQGLSLIDGGADAGKPLASVASRADWGENCDRFSVFPVLNKIIDAAKPLSVQVHPSDEYALSHEGCQGKTEMWYILSAEKGAGIYLGFNRNLTAADFDEAVKSGNVCGLLNKIEVKAGDAYFIPAGTVHAVGAGVTLYEVQQNSSLTYRVYDYGRTDKDGRPRELHIDKAREVLDFSRTEPAPVQDKSKLFSCKYFTAYALSESMTIGKRESFSALTVTEGNFSLGRLELKKGDTAFVSAGDAARLDGKGKYILTCVGDIYR